MKVVVMGNLPEEKTEIKKLSEVEASQSKVVAVCKKLEAEGKIQTGGIEEEYV